jgi:hypothetical protein
MWRIIGILLLLATVTPSMSPQTVGVGAPASLRAREVRDTTLRNVVVNSVILANKNLLKEAGLSVRVIAIAGESGSAREEETDTVVSWVYLGVSEFGEMVEQHAFRLGPVYNPKVDRIVAEGRIPVVYLSYGAPKHRQFARIEIDLKGIRIRAQ